MQSGARFIANGIGKHNEVAVATPLDENVVKVERKQYPDFIAGVVSASEVTLGTIQHLVSDQRIDFICNIPREAVWSGEAITAAERQGKAWGGVSDLYSAAGGRDPVRDFVRSEFKFIERIFNQHSAVSRVERMNDRVYRLHRGTMPIVDVALINEYDLVADHVRTAWDRYGPFTDILANNPNCRYTDDATDAAKSLGVKLLPLKMFMGRLNSR
jgi:hypothetical protein